VTELFQIDGEVACKKGVCHLWRTVWRSCVNYSYRRHKEW